MQRFNKIQKTAIYVCICCWQHTKTISKKTPKHRVFFFDFESIYNIYQIKKTIILRSPKQQAYGWTQLCCQEAVGNRLPLKDRRARSRVWPGEWGSGLAGKGTLSQHPNRRAGQSQWQQAGQTEVQISRWVCCGEAGLRASSEVKTRGQEQ